METCEDGAGVDEEIATGGSGLVQFVAKSKRLTTARRIRAERAVESSAKRESNIPRAFSERHCTSYAGLRGRSLAKLSDLREALRTRDYIDESDFPTR